MLAELREVNENCDITTSIIYIEMILDCDWSMSVQLIPNRSAKIFNKNLNN